MKKKMRSYVEAHMGFYEDACRFLDGSCYVDGTKSIRRAEIFIKRKK